MTRPVLFFDWISQPSRAVLLFIRKLGLDVEAKLLALHKGLNRKPEYLAINPLGKVPCLQVFPADGGQAQGLPESCAILRYLATTNQSVVPDISKWYPEEPLARARVDAALDWHHGTIRVGCAGQVFNRVIAPMAGNPGNEALALHSENVLKQALQAMEQYWLARAAFMAGDAISIADLPIACELEQLCMLAGAEGPSMEAQLADFPGVRGWMQRVAAELAPHWTDVNAMLHKAAAAAQRRRERQPQQQAKL